MNKRNLQNRELDAIGRKLIERGSSPIVEIEKIISNPGLFSLVSARIAAEGKTPSATVYRGSNLFFFVRRNAIAFASVAVLVVAAIAAVNLLRTQKDTIAANALQHPAAITPVAARPDNPPPQVVGRNIDQGRAQDRELTYEKAVVKQTSNLDVRRPRKAANIEPDAVFFPISYAGEPEEASYGGRIIRVDLKRSSLFAMGVNLPLENDDEVVKADLLVGSDGVARAIRVIK